jgi:hypothetical protein
MKPGLRSVRVVLPLVLLVAVLSVQAQHGRRVSNAYYPRVRTAVSISTPYMQLNWGGNPYYYNAGNFYRPNGGYYQSVPAPIGIHVNIPPRGYHPMVWGGNPYYYYNGTFYQQSRAQQDYEVVQAPVGAEVPSLPSEAKTMVIDGEKFYSVNGTYFKDAIHQNGELWYRVVGKHGVLNTYKNDGGYQQQQQYPQQYPSQQYPQRAPQQQQQYPQQYPSQQYPQAPQQQQQQQYPQQYPSQQYPQVPQQQQYPQAVPQPQYPVQDDVQPAAPRQLPQTENREPVRRVVPQAPQQEQGTLPPAQNGNREAVRRIPGQVAQSDVKKEQGEENDEEDEEEMIEGGAPDLILHDNPNVGWVVDRLPENCKTVTIKTKKYFVAPNGTYYEEYVDGRQVRYKVAGKESTIKKD